MRCDLFALLPLTRRCRHAFALYAERRFLGYRPHLADGSRGEYHWESYADVEKKVSALGSYIRGLVPRVRGI